MNILGNERLWQLCSSFKAFNKFILNNQQNELFYQKL